MSDDNKPLKRSEILAIENVRRIAEQLRAERNDAVALAQVRREQLGQAIDLLQAVVAHRAGLPAELIERVDGFLADPELP
jgi:hypothetical protein